MNFMDGLKKLTQPIDDEDEIYDGADPKFKPQPKAEERTPFMSTAQKAFESSFSGEVAEPDAAPAVKAPGEGGIFGGLGFKKGGAPKAPRRERTMNFGGKDTQVMLFSPKTFDEAGELVGYILQNTTVAMTLEGVPTDTARRLLDFMSGIAFALQGKIIPFSAKTYFVTPQNVDIGGTQTDQPESAGHYF